MRARGLWVAAGCLLLAASPASAQSLGVRGYFTYGLVVFSAQDSLEAVADTHRAASIGGGGSVTGLWRGLFVDVALSQQSLDGERVFVSGNQVYPLGIPLKLRYRPLDVAAGWRVTQNGYSTYAGGGISRIAYEESSDFSSQDENVSATRQGVMVLAGAEGPLSRWIQIGGEVRYRWVKGILGAGGVSEAFGEDQLGGFAAAIRVSVGR